MSPLEFMMLAVEEAGKGLGFVQPNPPVGCIIVSQSGEIIGKGAHLQYGSHHAEINALQSVSDPESLRGSTFYVTLEPCAHEANTPSCARSLAQLPISKVIYAIEDPNPLVAGQGAQILRDAGIVAEVLQDESVQQSCESLAEIFLWNMRRKSPFVAIKVGTSCDGSLTPAPNEKWLTGKKSREHVHFLRSQYQSVLVGVDTFLKDDPSLDIRIGTKAYENYAIVIDPSGRGVEKLIDSQVMSSRNPDKIIWVTNQDVSIPTSLGIRNVNLPLEHFMQEIWDIGIHSVFVEGGAKTIGHFLNNKLTNRIYHYASPKSVSEQHQLHWLSCANEKPQAMGSISQKKFGEDRYQSYLVRT